MEHGEREAFERRMRAKLEAIRDQNLKRHRDLKAWGLGRGAAETSAELSSIDQHTADHGTATYERTRDFGLLEEAGIAVEEAEDALERLDRGEYGQCITCGRPIGTARLEALPTATRCTDCARRREGQGPAPSEPALRPSLSPGTKEGWRSPAYVRRPHHDSPLLEEEGRQEMWSALGDYPSSDTPQDEPRRDRRRSEP